MKKVKHTLDTLPPLTEAQEDNLKRLATMPDEEINYDDRSQPAWMPMCWRGSSRKARATSPA